MPITAPPIHWPDDFSELGPSEDPAILLKGEARIAGTGFEVMALRLRDGMREPDYRPDLPETLYEQDLESLMGTIEDLTESLAPRLVSIDGARYLLWMVPSAAG